MNEQEVPQVRLMQFDTYPQERDLCNCDKCKGNVVGKAVATILQEQLEVLGKQELPESQCGFRKGRSCTDITFVIRQLMDRSWEHEMKSFLTFIDLKKAYDSVPWKGMWPALMKLGVPERMVNLV